MSETWKLRVLQVLRIGQRHGQGVELHALFQHGNLAPLALPA
jgi:hypothetical protein